MCGCRSWEMWIVSTSPPTPPLSRVCHGRVEHNGRGLFHTKPHNVPTQWWLWVLYHNITTWFKSFYLQYAVGCTCKNELTIPTFWRAWWLTFPMNESAIRICKCLHTILNIILSICTAWFPRWSFLSTLYLSAHKGVPSCMYTHKHFIVLSVLATCSLLPQHTVYYHNTQFTTTTHSLPCMLS